MIGIEKVRDREGKIAKSDHKGIEILVRDNRNGERERVHCSLCSPSRQNCRKSSVEECIFDNMASHIEC